MDLFATFTAEQATPQDISTYKIGETQIEGYSPEHASSIEKSDESQMIAIGSTVLSLRNSFKKEENEMTKETISTFKNGPAETPYDIRS